MTPPHDPLREAMEELLQATISYQNAEMSFNDTPDAQHGLVYDGACNRLNAARAQAHAALAREPVGCEAQEEWVRQRAESLLDWLDLSGRLMREYALNRIIECLIYVGENYRSKASQPPVLVDEGLTLDCVTETISGQYDHHFLNYQTATSLRIRRAKALWHKGDTVRVVVRKEKV